MRILSGVLAASLLASPVAATDLDAIRKIVSDPKGLAAPGCAIGAFRDGKTLFITAAGAADIASGRALDGDTLFYSASVAKQFTALAISTLVTQGKLGLDDDVRKYIPELPQYSVPVTIAMLMHHTSGVRDFLSLMELAGVGNRGRFDREETLRLVLAQKDTNFTPGTDWLYSNGGYLLLAEVIQRVSGMSYPDYMRTAILRPMGMTHSFFMNDSPPQAPNIAHGYVPEGEGFAMRDSYPWFGGSGGLMVSINDLAHYDHDFEVGGKVWTPAVKKIMLTPGTFTNGEPARRGFAGQAYAGGLSVGQRRGQYFIEHGGGAEAFKNQYAHLPERKLGVAVFCNRGDWNPGDKADAVIEAIEGPILAPEQSPLAPLAGRYFSEELQATYDISFGDKGLLTAAITSPYLDGPPEPMKLARRSDGTFASGEVVIVFDSNGRGFTVKMGRITGIHFTRAAT